MFSTNRGTKAVENQEKKLTKQAALLTTGRIIAFAMSFAFPLVIVRLLSQSEFGLYKQAFQVMASAVALPGLGLSTSAFYFMPRQPDKKPQIAMNVLIFYFLVGSAVALLFIVYPGWVTLVFKGSELRPYIPLLGIASLLWLLSSFLDTVTVADGDIRWAFIFSLLVQVTKIGLLLGACIWLRSIHAIIWAATVQGAVQCAFLFFYLKRRYGKFWQSFDRQLFKAQLAYALPFGLSGLAATTQGDLHNYFVSHYFDPAEFAVYAVGCFQLPLLLVLVDSVGSVVIPELAKREMRQDYSGMIDLWFAAMRKVAFFVLPACGAMFVLRHELIITLFTRNYVGAATIFAVNLLGLCLFINLTGAVVLAFDNLKYFRLKLYLGLIPVSCVALYFGIKTAGLLGAITAFVVVRSLDVLINVLALKRELHMTLSDFSDLWPIARIAVAVGLAGFSAWAVKVLLGEVIVFERLVIGSAVFGVVYILAALFLVRAVTEEEKTDLRNWLITQCRKCAVCLRLTARFGVNS